MDMLIAVIAACLYFLALGLVVPGLTNSNGIKTKPVFVFAVAAIALHILLLKDLILGGQGQNLSILNVASLISLLIAPLLPVPC